MQLGSVYLYPNRIDVYTNFDDWIHERYRKVYQRNLKVYRGVDNRVEFRVKTSDQKSVNIANRTIVFRLISRDSQELVIKKDCVTIDADIGRAFLNLAESEILDIEPGMYQYALSYETRSQQTGYYTVTEARPIYIDSQYGVNGTIEIFGSVDGEPQPSQTIEEFNYLREFERDPEKYFVSGLIDADAARVTPQSLHTFQLYFTNFSGRVILQGSLDISAAPENWVDIETRDYVATTQEYLNVTGKYRWFRFRVTPNDEGLFGDFTVNQTIFGNYDVTLNKPGKNYTVGSVITIKGNRLGGEQTTNDLFITVTGVDVNGGVTAFTHTGLSYNGVQQFNINNSAEINQGTVDKVLYR
jgi:hypothetical protein